MGLSSHRFHLLVTALAWATFAFAPVTTRAGLLAERAALENRIAEASSTDARAALLIELSAVLETTDPERALEVAREARAVAADERLRLAADASVASLLRLLADYTAAFELAETGLKRATELGDQPLVGRFTYLLGRARSGLSDFPEALGYYLAALRIADAVGDRGLAFDAHHGISKIFNEFRQPDQAQYHIGEAHRLALALGDPNRLGDHHRVCGNFALHDGDLAGARDHYQESLRIHTAAGNDRGVADALQNLGHAAERSGDLEQAREHTLRSIALYEPLGVRRNRLNALRQLGRILVKQGRPAEGLAVQEQALVIARALNSRSSLAKSYNELARAAEACGDLRAAFDWQQKLLAENEVLYGERSRQQLTILNTRFISERRQLEIDLLRREQALRDAELSRARAQRYWLLALAGLGGLAVAAVISRQRLKLRSERRILAETRLARDAAERADALKTRLFRIASHDLKNPLAAIVGGLHRLHEEQPAARPRIDALLGEGRRMFGLIHDLLDHAALEAGELRLDLAPLDLAALVRRAVDAHRPRAVEKTIALHLDLAAGSEALRIEGDAERLHQALANLLDNALKFTPPGGTVTVRLAADPDAVRISVADTGPGLAAGDFARLFTPFARLSAQPTAGESSTGLGLHICRELATLHRGRLVVQSRPGAGATFTLELPPVA